VNLTIAPSRLVRDGAASRRRTVSVDAAIVLSTSAALAHFVTTPDHFAWWPSAGIFFGFLGAAQLGYSALLVRGSGSERILLAGIWGTVAVILIYVASRTVGLPGTPPVPFHGTRWLAGQAMMPDGAKHVGPLDVFTLVAEVLLVIVLLGLLPRRTTVRTANRLMWLGLALWGASFVFLF
jgi:hypothetical protein